jgi:hypothetical protein
MVCARSLVCISSSLRLTNLQNDVLQPCSVDSRCFPALISIASLLSDVLVLVYYIRTVTICIAKNRHIIAVAASGLYSSASLSRCT